MDCQEDEASKSELGLIQKRHKVLSEFLMKQTERLWLEMASKPSLPNTKNNKELVAAHRKAVLKQINDWWTFIDFD